MVEAASDKVYDGTLTSYKITERYNSGWYFEPVAEGKYPSVIMVHGSGTPYNFKTHLPGLMDQWVKMGYIDPMNVYIPEIKMIKEPQWGITDFGEFVSDGYCRTLAQNIISGKLGSKADGSKTLSIGGYSMGGSVALFAGVHDSDIFSNVGALSPSWCFYNGEGGSGYVKYAKDMVFSTAEDGHFLLSYGKGEEQQFHENAKRDIAAIEGNGKNRKDLFKFVEYDESCGIHEWKLFKREVFVYFYYLKYNELPHEDVIAAAVDGAKVPSATPTPKPSVEVVRMPDVMGMHYEDAKKTIKDQLRADGFTGEIEIRIAWVHNNDPEKTCKVVQQTPNAGSDIPCNEDLVVDLCVAEQGINPTPITTVYKMPDVMGMHYKDAKKTIEDQLRADGFTGGIEIRIAWVHNLDPDKTCTVVQQTPAAGADIPGNEDLVVDLCVAEQGLTPTPVTPTPGGTTPVPPTPTMAVVKMPDVVGMHYEDAKKEVEDKLRADGFTCGIEVRIVWVHNNDPEKTCKVVQQDPEAGKTIFSNKDLVVDLYVAEQGITPTPVTPTPGDPTPVTPKPGDPTPVTPKPGEPTPVTPTPGDPTPDPEKEPSIADFVERLYTIALDRESEPEGKAFWINEIESGNRTGGDCAHFFLIEAPEFLNRGLNEEDFVETLYLTFFDRASEPAGKKFWVDGLKSGELTKESVIMGFIDSKEWCNVCATYGVKSGAPTAKAEFASKNAIKFATRLYTECLGREPEEGGLKYWSLALTNLEQTGCSAAKNFFTSDEFVGFKLKDDEYVRRLYTTFMGRDPEASEVAYWVGEIKAGRQTKDSVMAFFGQSEEFTNICKMYGIDRGTI